MNEKEVDVDGREGAVPLSKPKHLYKMTEREGKIHLQQPKETLPIIVTSVRTAYSLFQTGCGDDDGERREEGGRGGRRSGRGGRGEGERDSAIVTVLVKLQ